MKNILNNIILFLTILFSFLAILNSTDIVYTIRLSLNIWLEDIFPSLFLFFIISYILLELSFIEITNKIFGSILSKIFKIKKDISFVFIMSLLSGFPSSAKFTRELYDRNIINDNEATKLLTFTHFSNPIFILYTIAVSFIQSKEIGIIILISHYLSNIIIGIFFRNYYINSSNNSLFIKKEKKPLGFILNKAIKNTLDTLFLILGSITIFLIITTIINTYIHLKEPYNIILNGFLEMTQGLKGLKYLNLSTNIKTIMSTAFISFGGLSVHLQVLSIINDTKIKYYPYLVARIIHVLLSITICLILLNFR